MKDRTEDILDKPAAVSQRDSIDFDLKLVRGFGLSYFLYGLVYWLQVEVFLVPLPVVFYLVPIAGVLMFFRSIGKWLGSFIFLLIPFIVLKDLLIYRYPDLTVFLLIGTFLFWTIWAWSVTLKNTKKDLRSWLFSISQSMIWMLLLVKNDYIQVGAIATILVGVTFFVRKNINSKSMVHHVRVGLLIQLIIVLFLLQKISFLSVA